MASWRASKGSIGIALFSLLVIQARAETLTLATGEWPPYTSARLKHDGFTSRIVREAFEIEGVKVKLVYYPWARAIALAGQRNSGIDAVYPISQSPERSQRFYFSRPVAVGSNVFFHLRSQPFEWQTLADLSNKRIGANVGYNYGEDFKTAEEQGRLKVERVTDAATNFRKLFAKRLDVVLMNMDEAKYALAMQFPADVDEIEFHRQPVAEQDDYLAVNRNHPRARWMIETFNRGLTRLQQQGKTERYLQESRRGDYLPER